MWQPARAQVSQGHGSISNTERSPGLGGFAVVAIAQTCRAVLVRGAGRRRNDAGHRDPSRSNRFGDNPTRRCGTRPRNSCRDCLWIEDCLTKNDWRSHSRKAARNHIRLSVLQFRDDMPSRDFVPMRSDLNLPMNGSTERAFLKLERNGAGREWHERTMAQWSGGFRKDR
jgi:hypothetical protein